MNRKLMALALAAMIAGPAHAAVIASSGFDADVEGWTIAGDGAGPTWQSTGGDPDGYINASDLGQGIMWLFKAPAAYTGDQGAAFGGTLSYSLRVSGNNGWNPDGGDVFLVGNGGTRLAADSGPAPGTSWGQYSVALDSTGGWRFNTLSGAVATDAEILAVLSSLTSVEIRGEYVSGADNADLDTVSLESGEDGTARFAVTKVFSDGNDAEVEVTLSCNSGLPLQQSFTIAGGDPDGVTFVVTDIPETGADCEVTESGGPAGYTPQLTGCSWVDVTGGLSQCVILNDADDATYTVVKDWVLEGVGGDIVDATAQVTVTCDRPIMEVGMPYPSKLLNGGPYWISKELGDGDTLEILVNVDSADGAVCSATESVIQSGVESSSSGCGQVTLRAGDSQTCTFTNTVFFEGIPTLSQWGLALMALLMLGVGFIGFRRIV